MEFCPNCGSLLVMKKIKFGCPRCSYTSKEKMELTIKETVNKSTPVLVVDEKQGGVHPVTEFDCPKCNHKKSYFWTRQMRSGDEPESSFYKCVKCNNVIRVDN